MRKIPQPTQAAPGSEEKILVMQRRFKDDEELFHPDDPKIEHSSNSSQTDRNRGKRVLIEG